MNKTLLLRLLPALLTTAVLAMPARAENIDVLMSNVFPQQQPSYIGFDSVERADIPVSSNVDRKYLIVDFRFHDTPAQETVQASIHQICMTLIKDRELIRSLSERGYDMVSVAFDRQSQYDCL